MKKTTMLALLGPFLFSCGSHTVISYDQCLSNEQVQMAKKDKNLAFVNDSDLIAREGHSYSLLGKGISSLSQVDICQSLFGLDNRFSQQVDYVQMESFYSWSDVLWGILPFYDPRSVHFKVQFVDKELE